MFGNFDRGAVIVKFRSDISNLQQGLAKASGDISQFVNRNSSSFQRFETQQRRLNEQLRNLAERKDILNRRIDASTEKYGKNSVQVQSLMNQQKGLNFRYEETEQRIKDLGTGPSMFQRLGDSAKAFDRQLGGIPSKVINIGKQLATLALTAGVAFAGIGVAMGIGFGIQSFNTMVKFETQMSRLGSVSEATGEQMQALTRQARELGRTTEWSATQVADAQIQLAKTGLDSAQILKATGPMLSLATVGQLDLGRSADLATNTMTQFNLKAEDMGRVAGVMAMGANKAAQTVEDMAEGFSYLAPIAATLGMTIEQTASVTASLADAGLKGSRGNRVLATSLQRLAKPTKDMRESMGQLNLSFFDGQGRFKGFADVVEQMQSRFAGLTQEQQLFHASSIFGAEASGAWLKVIEAGPEKLRELESELGNAEEALAKLAFDALGPTERAMKNLESAYEGVLLSFSEAGLLDMVASLMQKIANVMIHLADKVETHVAPKMRQFFDYLRDWYNIGGRDAIVAFMRSGWEVFRSGVDKFIVEYWPKIKDALKQFRDWFGSQEGRDQMQRWADVLATLGIAAINLAEALAKIVTGFIEMRGAWNNLPAPLKEGISNLASGGLAGGAMGLARGVLGRSTGGDVEKGIYETGEMNRPELLEMGGRQYLIPGNKGRVFQQNAGNSKLDKPQKATKTVNIYNYNSAPDQIFTSPSLLFA